MVSPEVSRSSVLPHSQCWKFLEDEGEYTPAQGYREYCHRRQQQDLQPGLFYFSTTITSGGYARFNDLPKGEAIKLNSDLAAEMVNTGMVSRGIPEEVLLLPSELGKVTGWSQADYLSFWFFVIRAVSTEQAVELEERLFNPEDPEYTQIVERMEMAPAYNQRRQAYKDYVERYFEFKKTKLGSSLVKPFWPAPAVVPMVDNSYSLGCAAEYYFAEVVLPSWFPVIEQDRQGEVSKLMVKGAMVAGRTLEDERTGTAFFADRWAEYYARQR